MPLYEYHCSDCGAGFELLVGVSETPKCPKCGSEALDKQLSVFAVGRSAGGAARDNLPEPCRSCGDARGPGACGLG
jgi:putative FmdB family regulatory protein